MGTSDITVAALSADPTIRGNKLKWTYNDPRNNALANIGLDMVEVWASTTNDRATASKVGEGITDFLHAGLIEEETWYYWIKARDYLASYGAWYPSGATSGVSAKAIGFTSIVFGAANYTIVTSISAGALTIAIKTLAGNNPSSGDPVYVPFRDDAGAFSIKRISAAMSITIPSGVNGEMGVNGSFQPIKIWLVSFNVSGVLSLGVKNCYGGTQIWPLAEASVATASAIASSTTVTGVFYTSAAISPAAPYRVLAYLEWDAIGTPGTWIAPTRTRIAGVGVKLPGMIVQEYYETTASVSTITTTVPLDDTPPLFSTEGEVYFGTSPQVVPESVANILDIDIEINLSTSVDATVIGTVYINSLQTPIVCGFVDCRAGKTAQLRIRHRIQAGIWSYDAFVIKLGASAAGTLTINGVGGARQLAGRLFSSFKVQEIAA